MNILAGGAGLSNVCFRSQLLFPQMSAQLSASGDCTASGPAAMEISVFSINRSEGRLGRLRRGRLLAAMVGSVRHLPDLAKALGLDATSLPFTVLTEAWMRWPDEIVSRVDGDWALAVWEEDERRLSLVRSALSTHPLHCSHSQFGPVFASHAAGAAALADPSPLPDWSAITYFQMHMALPGDRTAFNGVFRVEAGSACIWHAGRWSHRRLWNPNLEAFRGPRDWLEEYRSIFRNSVASALPADGPVAAQLSAGRDSSAVAAVAASLARDQLVAITFAPSRGSVPPDSARIIFDESPIAARTARKLGIAHRIVQGGPPENSLFWLAELQKWASFPLLSAAGPTLRMAVAKAARDEGADTLLTGALGNLGLSSGGLSFLSAYRREQGLESWLRMLIKLRHQRRFRSLMNHSVASSLRRRIQAARNAAANRANPFWTEMLKSSVVPPQTFAPRFATAREEVFSVIQTTEMGDLAPAIYFGVELKDPTSDRALIELMLQVPAERLVDASLGRPLFEDAFRGQLDDELLNDRRRGRQAADWWKLFSPESLRSQIEELQALSIVRTAIDFRHTEKYLERWPRTPLEAYDNENLFYDLLSAVSLALFLKMNFASPLSNAFEMEASASQR